MSNAPFKIIGIQLLLTALSLFAFSENAPAQGGADARALERLKWMRQNE